MSSFAAQLATLSVVDSLQHSPIPGEAEWPKLAWAASRGSDLETGWKPPAWVSHEPTGSQGGFYLPSLLLTGSAGAVSSQLHASYSLAESRLFSVWLFTTGLGAANGYQLTARQIPATGKYIMRLAKYVEGAQTILSESPEVSIGVLGSFGLLGYGGKVSGWVRELPTSPFVCVTGEVADATFLEGHIGIDGNGSNPTLQNLAAGTILQASTLPNVSTGAEPQSGRLAFYLRRPDGSSKRIAGDEIEAEDVAQNFQFGTGIPGGFGNASLGLTRDPRAIYGDLNTYDELVALGPGNDTAYEGYNIEIPKSSADQTGLVATGWGAYLKNLPGLQEIYVDRDMSRVTGTSSSRKVLLLQGNYTPYDPSLIVSAVNGLPALELAFEGSWVSPYKPLAEGRYDAGPTARVKYVYAISQVVGAAAPNNTFLLQYIATDTDPRAIGSTEGVEAFPSGVTSLNGGQQADAAALVTARRYLMLQWSYPTTPAGSAGTKWAVNVYNLTIVGNHGLPLHNNEVSILASDVVADVVRRAAPLLHFSVGPEGSISPSSFGIPHLIFPQAVTAEEAIMQASKYDVPDWGVYDDRTFFWRPPTAGRLWEARESDPGAELVDAGAQAEDVYNGAAVEFTDPSGVTYMVGPPGCPGCDFFDTSLQDLSPTNPLNEHGLTRYGKLQIGPVTTLAGAIQLGSRWLEDELSNALRGTATLTGFCRDSYGVYEPVWKVRAGDRIRFDGGAEHRIIETTYNHEERTISLTLDSTPNRVDALMAKMEVELTAIGAGS